MKKRRAFIKTIPLLILFLIFIQFAYAENGNAANKGTKNFHELNKTLEISDKTKGNFTIQQMDITKYPILCPGSLTCKQENFNITFISDKNGNKDPYTFGYDDLGVNWIKYTGTENITNAEYYLLNTSIINVPNTRLNWSNTSYWVNTSYDNNVTYTTILVWNNRSFLEPDGTTHTEPNYLWELLGDKKSTTKTLDSLNAGDSHIIAIVFYKKAELGSFAIKTVPSFVGYNEDRMTWWNNSKSNMSNMVKPDGKVPYVLVYNFSNASGTSNLTHFYGNGLFNKDFSGFNVTDSNATEEPYTLIPKPDGSGEALVFINFTKNGSKQIYFNEGNLGNEVGNASNPNATFIQYASNMTTDYRMANVTENSATQNWQYWARVNKGSEALPATQFGLSNTGLWYLGDSANWYIEEYSGVIEIEVFNNSGIVFFAKDPQKDNMRDYKIIKNNTEVRFYLNNTLQGTITTGLPDESMGLFVDNFQPGGSQEYAFIMPYIEPEPSSGAWGEVVSSSNPPPTISSTSVSPSSVTTGNDVTITIRADGNDDNISSANVTVARPDYTTTTLALTCTYVSGNTSDCTRTYTANSGVGTYSINSFGVADVSGYSIRYPSSLTFEATAASSGSTGGGGGGGGAVIIYQDKEEDNATSVIPLLTLKNITTGATEPQLQEIADCLTQGLLMENKCSAYNYGVVVEPMNWWVFAGAFLASFGVVIVRGIHQDKAREWFTEPLLYGTTTTLVLIVLVAVGINTYLFNYLADSPKYAWTFASTALWGGIVALVWDNYYYGKKKYKILRNA